MFTRIAHKFVVVTHINRTCACPCGWWLINYHLIGLNEPTLALLYTASLHTKIANDWNDHRMTTFSLRVEMCANSIVNHILFWLNPTIWLYGFKFTLFVHATDFEMTLLFFLNVQFVRVSVDGQFPFYHFWDSAISTVANWNFSMHTFWHGRLVCRW